MYDDDKHMPSNVDPLAVLPNMPAFCSVNGCDGEAAIGFVQVQGNSSKILCGAAPVFCLDKKKNGQNILKREFMFRGWITRCSHCYDHDLRRSGKNQLRGAQQPEVPNMSSWSNQEKMIYMRNMTTKALKRIPEPEAKDYAGDRYADEERIAIQDESASGR